MDLSGKRALVTGGSSGIGLEIARQLLGRGARVVITGRRKVVLDQAVHALAGSRRITGISAAVTTPEGRRRALEGTLAALRQNGRCLLRPMKASMEEASRNHAAL